MLLEEVAKYREKALAAKVAKVIRLFCDVV